MVVKVEGLISFADVEARLIEAMRVWAWGNGRPGEPKGYATDAPWELMQLPRSERYSPVDDLADGARMMADAIERAVRMPRPDRSMIDRAIEVGAWLARIDERDRRLVVLAIAHLSAGASSVPWLRMRRQLNVPLGAGGLQRRYERAIGGLCRWINGGNPTCQRVKP